MVLGVIFLGTLATAIGATIRGAGFSEHPGSTLLGVLLGTVIPIYAFIAATYDGSLYALILVSILMPLIHLVFERKNWVIPPKKAPAEPASVG
jgi:YD repeat-containing protein